MQQQRQFSPMHEPSRRNILLWFVKLANSFGTKASRVGAGYIHRPTWSKVRHLWDQEGESGGLMRADVSSVCMALNF